MQGFFRLPIALYNNGQTYDGRSEVKLTCRSGEEN